MWRQRQQQSTRRLLLQQHYQRQQQEQQREKRQPGEEITNEMRRTKTAKWHEDEAAWGNGTGSCSGSDDWLLGLAQSVRESGLEAVAETAFI